MCILRSKIWKVTQGLTARATLGLSPKSPQAAQTGQTFYKTLGSVENPGHWRGRGGVWPNLRLNELPDVPADAQPYSCGPSRHDSFPSNS